MSDLNTIIPVLTFADVLRYRDMVSGSISHSKIIRRLAKVLATKGDAGMGPAPELENLSSGMIAEAWNGEAEKVNRLADLAFSIIGNSLSLNLLGNLSLMAGDSASSGLERLDAAFSGSVDPRLGKIRWKRSFFRVVHSLVAYNLGKFITNFIWGWCTESRVYHIESMLLDLLHDSILYHASGDEAAWDRAFNDLYIKKNPNLGKEVRSAIRERGEGPFRFRLTRVEPRIYYMSEYIEYVLSEKKYSVKACEDPEGGTCLIISLSDDLLREVRSRVSEDPIIQSVIEEAQSLHREISRRTAGPGARAKYRNLVPYARFFGVKLPEEPEEQNGQVEGPGEEEVGDVLEAIKTGLRSVAVPCIAALYPFVSIDAEQRLVVRSRTREPVGLARAVAQQIPISVPYARILLDGVHALRLIESGRVRMDDEMMKILGRASTAEFGPFLPPGFVVRHSRLIVSAWLLQLVNSLSELAGHHELVFEPSGDPETDTREMYRMTSDRFKAEFGKDADYLLNRISRESYQALLRVLRAPHFEMVPVVAEWYSSPFEVRC
ncbi:MAG: hypothetical protein QXP81_09990 [Nitrososphaerota archaeon]